MMKKIFYILFIFLSVEFLAQNSDSTYVSDSNYVKATDILIADSSAVDTVSAENIKAEQKKTTEKNYSDVKKEPSTTTEKIYKFIPEIKFPEINLFNKIDIFSIIKIIFLFVLGLVLIKLFDFILKIKMLNSRFVFM